MRTKCAAAVVYTGPTARTKGNLYAAGIVLVVCCTHPVEQSISGTFDGRNNSFQSLLETEIIMLLSDSNYIYHSSMYMYLTNGNKTMGFVDVGGFIGCQIRYSMPI